MKPPARQRHVGVVCWLSDDDKAGGGALTRLEVEEP
jgi:hypothetical protein